jgi:thiol-disulfide isomerase/thioredoxin
MLDGTKVQLEALRGQVVVINFWASWCVPCRTELPLLDTYYKMQKRHGLRVIAATTESSASYGQMGKLLKVLTIEPAKKIKGPYAPIKGAVPTNFIIGRDGTLRYAEAGALTLDVLNTELVPLLNERPTAAAPAASH